MTKKQTTQPIPRPAVIATTPNFANPPFWPSGPRAMTFTEKVQMLATLAPEKVDAFHTIIDSVLREEWWATARTDDGLARLAALVEGR